MKRKTLKCIACAAIMALALSAAACGSSDDAAPIAETEDAADEETAAPAEETEPEAVEEEAEPEAEPEAEDGSEVAEPASEEDTDDAATDGQTLEDIMNDPSVKEQYEAAFGSMAQDGMSVSVETKGNELAVIIKIEDSSLVVDGMGEALDAALDQQAATLGTMAGQLDEAIGAAGECTVTLRYLDPDDNVLTEKSFQAQ